MNIEAYIITWNREDIIHLTINHYKQFCSKVTIFDNFSDDRTREIAEWMDCEVKLFGKAGVLDDGEYLKIKNNCWKGSKADWVIVCDDDEILYHPDIVNFLSQSKSNGITIFNTEGYSMFSNDLPEESFLEIKTGIKDSKYSKKIIFNPSKVTDIGYVFGCHESNPKGRLVYEGGLSLLHYHAIGGAQRMINRHAQYEERRIKSYVNMKWGLGKEYGYSPESKRKWFTENISKATKIHVFV